jgi:hypothetical protein
MSGVLLLILGAQDPEMKKWRFVKCNLNMSNLVYKAAIPMTRELNFQDSGCRGGSRISRKRGHIQHFGLKFMANFK